ncbi:YopX family protein [Mammaliicoccus sciuri]|uniref:YopX family protein n=1 Tax=Mammaliicoccus sciuri TaxID=1296 RepID=UPI00194F352D|nr:YopX family protein [Mammaliicoccus sciuri]
MNRPNFRVWDIEEQKWYKPTYKAYMNELHDIHIDIDGRLLIRTIDESGKRVTIHESMFEGRYELLQSTGLKDINGKDIYEGDIVKIDDHPLQVYTSKISGVPIGVNINGNYVVEYSTEDMAYFIGNWKTREVIRHSEVVGNKFEHPHLLEEE